MAPTSCMPRQAAPGWYPESIYCEATYSPEDIYYEGSDDDDYESPEVRRQRYEAAGQRFLNGDLPFVLSAGLNGPFEASSGWTNPWRSKRQANSHVVKKKTALAKAPKRVTTKHSTPSQLQQTQESHLPSPESLKQVSVEPHPYLEEDSLNRVNIWRTNVEPVDATKDVFWSQSTIGPQEHASAKKRRARGSDWLQKTPSKKQKTFRDAIDPVQTPTTRRSRTVPVSSTKGRSKSYMKACVNSSFRSAPERLASLDNANSRRPGDDDELMDGLSSSFATVPVKSSSPPKRVSPKRAVWKNKRSAPVESEDELAHQNDVNTKAAATLSSPVSLKGGKKLKGKQCPSQMAKPSTTNPIENEILVPEASAQPQKRKSPTPTIEDDDGNNEMIDTTNPDDTFEDTPAQPVPDFETQDDESCRFRVRPREVSPGNEPVQVDDAQAIHCVEPMIVEKVPEEPVVITDDARAVVQPRESSPLSSVSSSFNSDTWAGLSSVGAGEDSNSQDTTNDSNDAGASVGDSEQLDIAEGVEITEGEKVETHAMGGDDDGDSSSDTESMSELSDASSMEEMVVTTLCEEKEDYVEQADDNVSDAESIDDSGSDSMSELSEPSTVASMDLSSGITDSQLPDQDPTTTDAHESITVTVQPDSPGMENMEASSDEESASDAETESSAHSAISNKAAEPTADQAVMPEAVEQSLHADPSDVSDSNEVRLKVAAAEVNEPSEDSIGDCLEEELPIEAPDNVNMDNASHPESDKESGEAEEDAEVVNSPQLMYDDNMQPQKADSQNTEVNTTNVQPVVGTPESISGSFSFRNILERIVPLSPWKKSQPIEVESFDKPQDACIASTHDEETISSGEAASAGSESYDEAADEDAARQLSPFDDGETAAPTPRDPATMEIQAMPPSGIDTEVLCEDVPVLEAMSTVNDSSVSGNSPAPESPCSSSSQTGSENYEDAIAEQLAPSQQSPWSKSQSTQMLGEVLSAMAAQALEIDSTPEASNEEIAVEAEAPQPEEESHVPGNEEHVAAASNDNQSTLSINQPLPVLPTFQPTENIRPTTPARLTTPEPQFMMPSFSAFMTPSPEYRARQRQRAKGRIFGGRVAKVQHSLPSALKYPWSSGKSGRRITWAPLPNESMESQDLAEERTTGRQASPPPMTAVEDLPTGKDAEFQGHFNVVAKRAADTPRRSTPTDSQESQETEGDESPNFTTSAVTPIEKPTSSTAAPMTSMFDAGDEGEEDGMDLTAQVFEDLEDLLRPWDMDAELDEVRKEPGFDAMEIDV